MHVNDLILDPGLGPLEFKMYKMEIDHIFIQKALNDLFTTYLEKKESGIHMRVCRDVLNLLEFTQALCYNPAQFLFYCVGYNYSTWGYITMLKTSQI